MPPPVEVPDIPKVDKLLCLDVDVYEALITRDEVLRARIKTFRDMIEAHNKGGDQVSTGSDSSNL